MQCRIYRSVGELEAGIVTEGRERVRDRQRQTETDREREGIEMTEIDMILLCGNLQMSKSKTRGAT